MVLLRILNRKNQKNPLKETPAGRMAKYAKKIQFRFRLCQKPLATVIAIVPMISILPFMFFIIKILLALSFRQYTPECELNMNKMPMSPIFSCVIIFYT